MCLFFLILVAKKVWFKFGLVFIFVWFNFISVWIGFWNMKKIWFGFWKVKKIRFGLVWFLVSYFGLVWFDLVWIESNFDLDLVWKFQNRIYFGLVWFWPKIKPKTELTSLHQLGTGNVRKRVLLPLILDFFGTFLDFSGHGHIFLKRS